MKAIAIFVIGVLVAIGIAYGVYQANRWVNWTFGYETKVQRTVCDMVKPEALKNPAECK